MLKRTAVLLGIVVLLLGGASFASAEAKSMDQSCFLFVNGKQIDLQSVDPAQLNKDVSALINQVLAQFKGFVPKSGEQQGKGNQAEKPVLQPAPQKPQQPQQSKNDQPAQNQNGSGSKPASSVSLNANEQKMVQLVNQERQKQGLAPLKVNGELVKVARAKAQDMIDKGYFGHHSPTYGSPDEMLKKFGVSYRYMGENLAGNSSVEGAHQSLMNSPGHRANILNGNFNQVGIGVVDGGPYGKMFVQLFTD